MVIISKLSKIVECICKVAHSISGRVLEIKVLLVQTSPGLNMLCPRATYFIPC